MKLMLESWECNTTGEGVCKNAWIAQVSFYYFHEITIKLPTD